MAYRFTNAGTLDAAKSGFVAAVEACWSADTSNDPAGWSADTPGFGQCAVTALIVQDHFGGELMRGEFAGGSHYWNRLPDGSEIDLTAAQFETVPNFANVAIRSRAYVVSYPTTVRRYDILKSRLGVAAESRTLELA